MIESRSGSGVKELDRETATYRESQSRHESTLLEPEDRGERSREEDSLDGGESDETFSKDRSLITDPLERPVGLLLDAGNWNERGNVSDSSSRSKRVDFFVVRTGLDRVEKLVTLLGFAHIGVDEKRVDFRVNVFPAKHDARPVRRCFERPPRRQSTHIMIWKP